MERNKRATKYCVQTSYFDKWSHDMAYIIGFIAADGHVDKYSLSIELQERDCYILEIIKNKLISNEYTLSSKILKGKIYKRLRVHSIDIVKSLSNYGIVNKKSSVIRINFNIPDEFVGDYIRGVFDGDGWVTTRRNSIEGGICSASRGFLEDLQKICGMGKIQVKNQRKSTVYGLEFSKNNMLKLRDLMYRNKSCICLKRKKEKMFSDFYKPSERWWTEKDIDFLLKNFSLPAAEISEALHKTKSSVNMMKWRIRHGQGRFSATY